MSREDLQRELEHLKALNTSVDELLEITSIVSDQIYTTKKATDTSSALIGDWIKMLNQMRFISSVVTNPNWKGALDPDSAYQHEVEKARLKEELEKQRAEDKRLDKCFDAEESPKPAPDIAPASELASKAIPRGASKGSRNPASKFVRR